MDKLELMEGLLHDLQELKYDQEAQRNLLIRRAKMLIRNIFGGESSYLKDLSEIRWFSPIGPASEETNIYFWKSGQDSFINLVNTMKEEIILFDNSHLIENGKKATENLSKKIFIIHGHDEEMKQAIARVVEKLGFNPIILHEQPNKGRTIIEKFTDYSDVGFAIALLSPDDLAYSKESSPEQAKYRARQNVIFELGFFIGKLGRSRVLAMFDEKNNFEKPSDYDGIIYVPYEKNGNWQFEIMKELKACGYQLDANILLG
jgi:predicted nucleotide-binding protein